MRNPLSAILQSADTALTSLARLKSSERILQAELDDAIEAIQTVMLCSTHQKRIIDDTLTMSKVESRLLLITPVPTQPIHVVQKVMKMFEMDFSHKGISAKFIVHPSYHAMDIDWVKADPSRFTQVLLNLLTNGTQLRYLTKNVAVKFTADEKVRQITVTLGPVSTTRPDLENSSEILASPNVSPQSEKDILYLTFSVADTGRGLSNEEKAILFQKFTQASPETHVNYGGSGLGLFISRILTELQGGQIIVESKQDQGSTFSFYIETERMETPKTEHIGAELIKLSVGEVLPSQNGSTRGKILQIPASEEYPSYNILVVEVWICVG
jgi:signal transduction histidine kinase